MNVKLRQIVPNVFVFTFDTQYDLCMSFVRIQEFYESPEFKGKYFTLEEYMDWWAKNYGNGSFDYPRRWNGFNVPGTVLKEWFTKFKCFRDKEVFIWGMLYKRINFENLDNIYVIGVNSEKGNKADVIKHELAHAMYALYPKYRKSCDRLLTKMGKSKEGKALLRKSKKQLLKMGYHKDVVKDEQQAYFSTSNKQDRFPQLEEFKENFDSFKKTAKTAKKKVDKNVFVV